MADKDEIQETIGEFPDPPYEMKLWDDDGQMYPYCKLCKKMQMIIIRDLKSI